MIVADTSAVIALLDRDDKHHMWLRRIFQQNPDEWLLPWAILPEVDYLLGARLSEKVRRAFFSDVAEGAFMIEWGSAGDIERAHQIDAAHAALKMGLVDATVLAVAERLRAKYVATLDLKHFGAARTIVPLQLLPRDG